MCSIPDSHIFYASNILYFVEDSNENTHPSYFTEEQWNTSYMLSLQKPISTELSGVNRQYTTQTDNREAWNKRILQPNLKFSTVRALEYTCYFKMELNLHPCLSNLAELSQTGLKRPLKTIPRRILYLSKRIGTISQSTQASLSLQSIRQLKPRNVNGKGECPGLG